jgi:hypothetical protein
MWETVADHEGMTRWSPGVSVSLERPGDPAPNEVGAVRLVRMVGLRIREEVTAFDPQRRLAYKALSGMPLRDYSGAVVLDQQGDKTHVTWTLTCAGRLPTTRLILAVHARVFLGALIRAAKRRPVERVQ